jgi:hypothetical protein
MSAIPTTPLCIYTGPGAFCGWDSELCLTLRGATVRSIRALYSGEDVILEMRSGEGMCMAMPLGGQGDVVAIGVFRVTATRPNLVGDRRLLVVAES